MLDMKPSPPNLSKLRRDWGLQNIVGVKGPVTPLSKRADYQKQQARRKIAHFLQNAVYPQQLTIPRDYLTTETGVRIYKILEGRPIKVSGSNATFREKGIRVVVLENGAQARFIMSPLFGSKHDALTWAQRHTGVN